MLIDMSCCKMLRDDNYIVKLAPSRRVPYLPSTKHTHTQYTLPEHIIQHTQYNAQGGEVRKYSVHRQRASYSLLC